MRTFCWPLPYPPRPLGNAISWDLFVRARSLCYGMARHQSRPWQGQSERGSLAKGEANVSDLQFALKWSQKTRICDSELEFPRPLDLKIFNKRDSNLWQLNPQEYAQLYDSRPKPIEVRNIRKHGPFSARDTGKPQVRGGGRGGRFGRIWIPGKTGGKVKIQLPSSSWGPPQFPLRGAPLLSRLWYHPPKPQGGPRGLQRHRLAVTKMEPSAAPIPLHLHE